MARKLLEQWTELSKNMAGAVLCPTLYVHERSVLARRPGALVMLSCQSYSNRPYVSYLVLTDDVGASLMGICHDRIRVAPV